MLEKVRELELVLLKCHGALVGLMACVMKVAHTHYDPKTRLQLKCAVDEALQKSNEPLHKEE